MKGIDTSLRRFQILGYASIVVMLMTFGAWSVLTALNGAVIAQATIIAESNTKRIQHKEGGIVRDILVRDGDRVRAGQELVILDDTEARAELGIVDSILVENLAKRARLEAQRDGSAAIEFPSEILERKADSEIARIINGQTRLFQARLSAITSKKDQLRQQIEELTRQISGIDAQIASNAEQTKLIKKELHGLQLLLVDGLVPITRVLALQREEARLEGNRGELIASKAAANSNIAEIKLQILQIEDEDRTQSLSDLREAETRVNEMRERKFAISERLSRTVIRSPISGDVYQLALHTVGGVITPAETLMLVVPDADELVLQAQVSPQNIDKVQVGQFANIRFPTFNAQTTPQLAAEVTQVSADTTKLDAETPPFYTLRLRIAAHELEKLGDRKLKPGMPAEAFIQTAAQTPLTYLLKPLMDQIARTFREP